MSGSPLGTTDANGSVRLSGRVNVLRFTARPNFVGGSVVDGIYLQLGGRVSGEPG